MRNQWIQSMAKEITGIIMIDDTLIQTTTVRTDNGLWVPFYFVFSMSVAVVAGTMHSLTVKFF